MISIITLLGYPLAIQYVVRGWKWLYPFAIVILVLDVIANYTELVVLTQDFPEAGEYTFSKRLERLRHGNLWQRFIAKLVIPYLNFFQPGHVPD